MKDPIPTLGPKQLKEARQMIRDNFAAFLSAAALLNKLTKSAINESDETLRQDLTNLLTIIDNAKPIMDAADQRLEPEPKPMPTMSFAKPPLKRGIGVRTVSRNVTSQPSKVSVGDLFDATTIGRPTRQPEAKSGSSSMWPDYDEDDNIPF